MADNIGMSEFVKDIVFMAEEKKNPKKRMLSLLLKRSSSFTALPSKYLKLEKALQPIQATNTSSESQFDLPAVKQVTTTYLRILYHGTQRKQ